MAVCFTLNVNYEHIIEIMLKCLNITNLILIHHLNTSFHGGLNLLTGETGAGKSILIDALSLLGGVRATSDLIRTGERRAIVEGVFEVKNDRGIGQALAEATIDGNGEELIVRRELLEGGRSRIFINDQLTTLAVLKTIAPSLFEIYGQGEQYALAAARTQMEMVDDFAGADAERRRTAQAYDEWKSVERALEEFERNAAERNRLRDFHAYQLQEIERIAPRPGEDEELETEKKRLAHSEKALTLSAGAYAELYESDESILTRLAAVRRRVQELMAIDDRTKQTLDSIEAAHILLMDTIDYLRDYGSGEDFSRTRLDEVESRLAELEKLKRKYNQDLHGVCKFKDELQTSLVEIEEAADREDTLRSKLQAARARYIAEAKTLSEMRRRAIPMLEKRVVDELRAVAMERAQFTVKIETAETPNEGEASVNLETVDHSRWTPHGYDRLEFLLSTNEGEVARPLARVASGGELSRLMLTLRTICQNKRSNNAEDGTTLIFDEIDAGISGRVAEAVGRRLKKLSQARQILCVTHQPQIARFADHHFSVKKATENGRTVTAVKELDAEERVGELARLIGGSEDVTTAREAARWLIETAANGKRTRSKRISHQL